MSEEYSVAILTPSCRNPSWAFTTSLVGILLHVAFKGIRGNKASACHYVQPKCSCLPNGRQYLLNLAYENSHTHALFIDDDIKFESDILDALVHEGTCIGANCLRKQEGDVKTSNTVSLYPGDGLVDSSTAHGLEEVYSMGLGVFCIDLKQIAHIKAPHFLQTYDKETKTYLGEDVSFTSKLRLAGIKIYCSHEASRKVGHLGERLYTW